MWRAPNLRAGAPVDFRSGVSERSGRSTAPATRARPARAGSCRRWPGGRNRAANRAGFRPARPGGSRCGTARADLPARADPARFAPGRQRPAALPAQPSSAPSGEANARNHFSAGERGRRLPAAADHLDEASAPRARASTAQSRKFASSSSAAGCAAPSWSADARHDGGMACANMPARSSSSPSNTARQTARYVSSSARSTAGAKLCRDASSSANFAASTQKRNALPKAISPGGSIGSAVRKSKARGRFEHTAPGTCQARRLGAPSATGRWSRNSSGEAIGSPGVDGSHTAIRPGAASAPIRVEVSASTASRIATSEAAAG